jgi:hypothetical protein
VPALAQALPLAVEAQRVVSQVDSELEWLPDLAQASPLAVEARRAVSQADSDSAAALVSAVRAWLAEAQEQRVGSQADSGLKRTPEPAQASAEDSLAAERPVARAASDF